LLVASRLSNHRQTLLVSSEVEATAFKQVNVLDSACCGFSDHVLVAQEGAASNCVLSVTAVI
jgi:hypothetical protein